MGNSDPATPHTTAGWLAQPSRAANPRTQRKIPCFYVTASINWDNVCGGFVCVDIVSQALAQGYLAHEKKHPPGTLQ